MATQAPDVLVTIPAETSSDASAKPDVPSTEVIKPSPFNVSGTSTDAPATEVPPAVIAIDDPILPVVLSNGVASAGSKAAKASVDSSGEFSPAVDCEQPLADKEPRTEVAIQVQEPTRLIEVSGEDDLRRLPRCCPLSGAICRFYFSCFQFVTNPKCLLPLQFLLLAVPMSSGFMAARYINDCPGSSATPMLLFMIGVSATVTIFCRMCFSIRSLMLEGRPNMWILKTVTTFSVLILLLLLTTEMISFFQFTPSFEFGTDYYCSRTFYEFTYWINWGFLALIVIICFLYIPECLHESITQNNVDV